ncbi:MAG: NADH-quinone oxidoreductase subunit J [Acidobacteriaceae bacterium]|jgi:NADH-quinone oxidoreductase subunit J
MTISFLLLAAITIIGTAAAMTLKNLVHCVLALSLGLVGLAALYLQLGAQFVGFTQILVYVGAVAILAAFAIMMTRSADPTVSNAVSSFRASGALIAILVFAVLAWATISGTSSQTILTAAPEGSVGQVGTALMHRFVLPLEVVGLLLTAALIGAGILAMDEHRGNQQRGRQ